MLIFCEEGSEDGSVNDGSAGIVNEIDIEEAKESDWSDDDGRANERRTKKTRRKKVERRGADGDVARVKSGVIAILIESADGLFFWIPSLERYSLGNPM